MANPTERVIDKETYDKLNQIYTNAVYSGSFGESLDILNLEELETLMAFNEKFLYENISEWSPGVLGSLIIYLRKKFNKNNGKSSDIYPESIKILQKLRLEIISAFGKFKTIDPDTVRPDQYMQKFLEFLNSLDEKERGPNATNGKIKSYVKLGSELKTPNEDPDGKIVISYNLSFKDNLAFIQEHINDAITRNNLRETDLRLRRYYDED